MSHITGGGLPGNLPRVLPDGCGARLQTAWERPGVFELIAKGGPVSETEMFRTFNMGVGMVAVVAPEGGEDVFRGGVVALAETGCEDEDGADDHFRGGGWRRWIPRSGA